ncbi:MAG: hypothetical protein R6X22_00005, partial [Gemmatimonadota bacterium]
LAVSADGFRWAGAAGPGAGAVTAVPGADAVAAESGADAAAGGPGASRGSAPAGAAGLRAAWLEAIEAAKSRGGLRGEAIGLRGATLRGLEGSELDLRVPSGFAGDLRSFLDDEARSAVFRRALGRRIGVKPTDLVFRLDDAGPRRRLTAETARDQKLEQMMEADPGLRDAVQALDLRLKE